MRSAPFGPASGADGLDWHSRIRYIGWDSRLCGEILPMPIFEYRCRECGTKFEKIVSSGATKITCAKCSSARVDKLLSVFAVSAGSRKAAASEPGPCPCGAPRRGMCGGEIFLRSPSLLFLIKTFPIRYSSFCESLRGYPVHNIFAFDLAQHSMPKCLFILTVHNLVP